MLSKTRIMQTEKRDTILAQSSGFSVYETKIRTYEENREYFFRFSDNCAQCFYEMVTNYIEGNKFSEIFP